MTDYHHGEMDIEEQRKTFHGFLRLVVWGCALTAVVLLFLTLHFTRVALPWFQSLAVALVVGALIGLALRMKGAWYATLIGLAILTAIVGIVASIASSLL